MRPWMAIWKNFDELIGFWKKIPDLAAWASPGVFQKISDHYCGGAPAAAGNTRNIPRTPYPLKCTQRLTTAFYYENNPAGDAEYLQTPSPRAYPASRPGPGAGGWRTLRLLVRTRLIAPGTSAGDNSLWACLWKSSRRCRCRSLFPWRCTRRTALSSTGGCRSRGLLPLGLYRVLIGWAWSGHLAWLIDFFYCGFFQQGRIDEMPISRQGWNLSLRFVY